MYIVKCYNATKMQNGNGFNPELKFLKNKGEQLYVVTIQIQYLLHFIYAVYFKLMFGFNAMFNFIFLSHHVFLSKGS